MIEIHGICVRGNIKYNGTERQKEAIVSGMDVSLPQS